MKIVPASRLAEDYRLAVGFHRHEAYWTVAIDWFSAWIFFLRAGGWNWRCSSKYSLEFGFDESKLILKVRRSTKDDDHCLRRLINTSVDLER
jgi:hypothetical protein